jgi:AsmA family protein
MSIVARHKRLTTAILIFGALIALVVIFLSFFNWNLARPALARAITSKTGRATSIDGDLKVHWWSWTPSAQINGVTVSNPPWADRDRMFAAKRITLSISVGHLLRGQLVIPEITLVEPVINLERDSSGRASWELGNAVGKPNGNTAPPKIPAIRRLVIQNGHLHVLDEIRHLRFGGSIVADERSGDNSASAFKIAAKGSLNEKPFGLDASGGPLLDLTPDKPYSFSLHVTASDINLEAQVSVLKPFNLGLLDVKFAVSGKDLADVYYLTGLALPNTPHYRLAALLHVSGTTITADDLSGHLGTSDISGTIAVQTAGARPKLTAKLNSKTLNIVDLAPTLGHPEVKPQSLSSTDTRSSSSKNRRDTPANAAGTDRFLPDADLQVNRVRGMDADVTYRARAVTAPKVPMKEVSFHLVLDNGLLNLDPLSFVLDQGKFSGNIQINARNDIPESSIDMHIEDMDLGQFKPATLKDAPLAGPLIGRMKIHGFGHSVHKLAASADGSISFLIPHGEINQALAELTGINVTRGLGLLLAKNETKTAIRCGVIDFQAEKGDLSSKTLFIDTEDVLIKGRGGVKLDSETIHLAVEGDPKKLRFTRVRSPITVDGTLSHPAVGLDAGKLAKQGAVATALGTLLTPAAALIAFIDPGRAKDKDCVASSSEVSESVQNN